MLVEGAQIHDRMPLILAPANYTCWLSDEHDPSNLMRPFPSEAMRMWPISTRVNKPENDDPSILEPIQLAASAAWSNMSEVARLADILSKRESERG